MDHFFSGSGAFWSKKASLTTITAVILLLFFSPRLHSQSAEEGRQLFQQCTACHTIGGGRLVGPDLAGINEQRDEQWLISFIQNSQAMIQAGDEQAVEIFNEYNKVPMPPQDLTDEEVRSVLQYIEFKSGGGEDPEAAATSDAQLDDKGMFMDAPISERPLKEGRNLSSIFWIMLVLIILAIVDLAVTRFIKAKFVHIIVIIIGTVIVLEVTVVEAIALGRQEGYSPEQPIWFSHQVHVQQNKIDCKYCHHTVENSKYAGIPSADLCMNCHNVVKEGTRTGTEEIAKIYAAIENNEPIEWIKVHNLPDHVFFSHAQHVNAGQIDCNVCHGPVEEMDRVRQVSDLSMGWCVNCHRDTEVSQFTTNKFYDHYVELHEQLKAGEIERVTVEDIGGNDCMKCHY